MLKFQVSFETCFDVIIPEIALNTAAKESFIPCASQI
jgi:hypothetical protein